MKSTFSTELKVGITVITSTLILIFGIIWGKGYSLQTDSYEIKTVFDEVGGLIPGDPVTVNGVKEGKIAKIGWHGRKVLCTLEIDDHIQLYEDAKFTVISAELLAGMKVEISPGISARKINMSHQPFKGKYGGRIVDVGMVIGELAEEMTALSNRIDTTVIKINTILDDGTIHKNITSSLDNLNKAGSAFAELPKNIGSTLDNLDKTITSLNRLVNSNENQLGGTIKNMNLISSRLDTAAGSLRVVMSKIEKREGTLGKLVNDTKLYNDLSRTLMRVDSLTKQIKDDGLELNFF